MNRLDKALKRWKSVAGEVGRFEGRIEGALRYGSRDLPAQKELLESALEDLTSVIEQAASLYEEASSALLELDELIDESGGAS